MTMVDYEQVTKDIREGFSTIRADKESKSEEIIMKEILAVLTTACEQNDIDNEEFMQAFFEWYMQKTRREAT
jgi:hypothetical protein